MTDRTDPFRPDDLTSEMPPDAAPKKRGRPPGSTNKVKPSAKDEDIHTVPPQPSPLRALLLPLLAKLDFSRLGTAGRSPLFFMRDTSPSEMPHDPEFREGGNAIAPTIAMDRIAANLIDIVLCHGAEDFEVVSVEHAKNFRMPDEVRWGRGTNASPWFKGIMEAVAGYEQHLSNHGLSMADVYVVFVSDFLFGDQFVESLAAFREWQEKDKRVHVIPVGHGAWLPEVAEKVSVRVKPVDLNKLRITDFIKVVAQSVREMTRSRPDDRAAILAQLERLGN